MPETVTDIVVDASVDRVWRVLADFAEYPQWNPYIRRMVGFRPLAHDVGDHRPDPRRSFRREASRPTGSDERRIQGEGRGRAADLRGHAEPL